MIIYIYMYMHRKKYQDYMMNIFIKCYGVFLDYS